jgi:hypothetical protein
MRNGIDHVAAAYRTEYRRYAARIVGRVTSPGAGSANI